MLACVYSINTLLFSVQLRLLSILKRMNAYSIDLQPDLFKVYQTGELKNLDSLSSMKQCQLQETLRLRDMIYSKQFRRFVGELTMCGADALTETVDCSVNIYGHRGHLLCHDDVIGTRKVSYILYLTNPDDAWTEEDGGGLELFPLIQEIEKKRKRESLNSNLKSGDPANDPIVVLMPTFGTMVLFTVQPGISFHAVAEVLTDSKPRMSISGWFHGKAPPENDEKASRRQLVQNIKTVSAVDMDDRDVMTLETRWIGANELAPLPGYINDEDIHHLSAWIRPEYLTIDMISKLREKFEEETCFHLHKFLVSKVFCKSSIHRIR